MQSDSGDVRLGHYRLITTSDKYCTKSHIRVDHGSPVNPGATPTVPSNASSPHIDELHREHKTNLLLFCIYNKYDKALKEQLISAVDDCFISTLKDKDLRYGKVSSLDIITHIFAAYGMISDSEFELNEENMTPPWTPPCPPRNNYSKSRTA